MSLALIDTNILVYRFDSRYLRKQEIATEILRRGLLEDRLRIPHQALVEFVAVVTRLRSDRAPLLGEEEARQEAEEFLNQFQIIYPNEAMFRLALRGAATYHLSWYDAHLWAYAESYGCSELITEDFQHGRVYGMVKVANPFA